MPYVIKRLVDLINEFTEPFALLVVDKLSRPAVGTSQGPATEKGKQFLLKAQAEVHSACKGKNAITIEVEFGPQSVPKFHGGTEVFQVRKGIFTSNAFEAVDTETQDTLRKFLNQAGIKHLVIMGYYANACVLDTTGASLFNKLGAASPGALQLGFTVATCAEVIHADELTKTDLDQKWIYDMEGLSFCSSV